MNLSRLAGPRWARLMVLGALLLVSAPHGAGRALASGSGDGDRVTVRGNYYRERSTRVLQPLVQFRKAVPDERLNLGVEYLLDAISSASIGAGAAALGSDSVFTELRHESTAFASSRLREWTLNTAFRYSTETDYTSRNANFGLSRDFLKRTLTLSARYGYSWDRVYRVVNAFGNRQRWTSSGNTNLLDAHVVTLGVTQVMARTLVAGMTVDGLISQGPQDNPYRRVRNGNTERHPLLRRRIAPALWMRWSIPAASMVVEPRYRYHHDDWGVRAHAIDSRLHFRIAGELRLRLRYRWYRQGQADFWRDDGDYNANAELRSDDPKMDDFRSHTPGIQLTWELDGLARKAKRPALEGAWIQATYNHVLVRCTDPSPTCVDGQTRFGDARLGSLAFSLAF